MLLFSHPLSLLLRKRIFQFFHTLSQLDIALRGGRESLALQEGLGKKSFISKIDGSSTHLQELLLLAQALLVLASELVVLLAERLLLDIMLRFLLLLVVMLRIS